MRECAKGEPPQSQKPNKLGVVGVKKQCHHSPQRVIFFCWYTWCYQRQGLAHTTKTAAVERTHMPQHRPKVGPARQWKDTHCCKLHADQELAVVGGCAGWQHENAQKATHAQSPPNSQQTHTQPQGQQGSGGDDRLIYFLCRLSRAFSMCSFTPSLSASTTAPRQTRPRKAPLTAPSTMPPVVFLDGGGEVEGRDGGGEVGREDRQHR